jgi:hypothetical protein
MYNFERANLQRLNKGAAELLNLMRQTSAEREDVGFDEAFVFGHPSLGDDAIDFMEYVFCATLHRLLILSEGGVTGLAPSSVQEGDEIWVLFSCPEPILLRPLGSHSTASFSVIGPAYLDGMMRGEILEDSRYPLADYGIQTVTLL